MTTHCLLCYRPLPRRWWHLFIRPLRVCSASDAAACNATRKAYPA